MKPTHEPEPSRRTDNEPAPSLLAEIYTQLRAAAQLQMAKERANHTLTATALVHEAWLRLAGPREIPFERRAHMYAAAVEAMRHVLLDHAKARGRSKRGGRHKTTRPIDFDAPLDIATDDKVDDFLIVDEAIEKLREHNARMAEVVRLRVLGGLSVAEIAALLGVSERTVKSEWAFARAWLGRYLEGDDA